jgi:hypothetical protein
MLGAVIHDQHRAARSAHDGTRNTPEQQTVDGTVTAPSDDNDPRSDPPSLAEDRLNRRFVDDWDLDLWPSRREQQPRARGGFSERSVKGREDVDGTSGGRACPTGDDAMNLGPVGPRKHQRRHQCRSSRR